MDLCAWLGRPVRDARVPADEGAHELVGERREERVRCRGALSKMPKKPRVESASRRVKTSQAKWSRIGPENPDTRAGRRMERHNEIKFQSAASGRRVDKDI